jgi:hypothetical protein
VRVKRPGREAEHSLLDLLTSLRIRGAIRHWPVHLYCKLSIGTNLTLPCSLCVNKMAGALASESTAIATLYRAPMLCDVF